MPARPQRHGNRVPTLALCEQCSSHCGFLFPNSPNSIAKTQPHGHRRIPLRGSRSPAEIHQKESTQNASTNQRGRLRYTQSKTGPSAWEFLWHKNDPDRNRKRRTPVIGTMEQFPTRDLAEVAVNGLRMSMDQNRNRQREPAISVADLLDHYIQLSSRMKLTGAPRRRELSTESFLEMDTTALGGCGQTSGIGMSRVTRTVGRRWK
jgi:hypothetical protein